MCEFKMKGSHFGTPHHNSIKQKAQTIGLGFLHRAPSGARFLRVKVPNPPGSGKDIAEGKGVRREAESEGSWMWGTY